jgi:hypothetical protein
MGVRFFYVDESYTQEKFCLSAISIRHADWSAAFKMVKDHRKALKEEHGVFMRKEIHARELVSGRGRISDKIIGKGMRNMIFAGLLKLVASLPHVWIFNVCLESAGRVDVELDAWERLLNRIERTTKKYDDDEDKIRNRLLSNLGKKLGAPVSNEITHRLLPYVPRSMIFADEGRVREITSVFRKMNIHNPIPSAYGGWGPGKEKSRNIPVQRILEDPVFKQSHQSFFIQLVDCVAFALLKRELQPTEHVLKYHLNEAFESYLSGVCFKAASPRDPLGIVRR